MLDIDGRLNGKITWISSVLHIKINFPLQRRLRLAKPSLIANPSMWGEQVAKLSPPLRRALLKVPVTFTVRQVQGSWRAADLQFDADLVDANARQQFIAALSKISITATLEGDTVHATFPDGIRADFTYSARNPDRTRERIRRHAAENGIMLPDPPAR